MKKDNQIVKKTLYDELDLLSTQCMSIDENISMSLYILILDRR